MIALLVGNGIHILLIADYVMLQLAHSLHLQAGGSREGKMGLAQDILRRTLIRLSVAAVVRAEKVEGRNLAERIQEGCLIFGNHIQITLAGLYEGEEVASVHTLT